MPTLKDLSDGKERMPIEVRLSSTAENHAEEEIIEMLEGFEEVSKRSKSKAGSLLKETIL